MPPRVIKDSEYWPHAEYDGRGDERSPPESQHAMSSIVATMMSLAAPSTNGAQGPTMSHSTPASTRDEHEDAVSVL
jgi:hypothetical protein